MKTVFRIHPAIGVARLGDSPTEYFIGPEAPGVQPSLTRADEAPTTSGTYKDQQHHIKRQGARFRVYEYHYTSTNVLQDVREVTAADARIQCSVHLAHRNAAAPRFEGTGRRNHGVPVADL